MLVGKTATKFLGICENVLSHFIKMPTATFSTTFSTLSGWDWLIHLFVYAIIRFAWFRWSFTAGYS